MISNDHSSQGFTLSDTVVLIGNDITELSNLVFLVVSLIKRLSQLLRVIVDFAENNNQTASIGDDVKKKHS